MNGLSGRVGDEVGQERNTLSGGRFSDPFTCARSRILHDSSYSGVTFSTALHYKSV